MRQRSVPEMLAVSRRTKYPCVLPIWRERTLPSGRKWPRCGRNLAAVAASLVNTRTVLLTSDQGIKSRRGDESWIKIKTLNFCGGMMDRMGLRKWR